MRSIQAWERSLTNKTEIIPP